jgi:predicted ATPase
MGAGQGGQVLSAATTGLVEGVEVTDLGEHRLRDLATPEHLFPGRHAAIRALGRALFPDGVWVVELGSLADAAAIPSALSSVLEVVTKSGQAVIDRVIEFLSDRRALLIVDNCEHVLDDAAELVQRLLEACANLVVLATSRVSLSILGEHTSRCRQ